MKSKSDIIHSRFSLRDPNNINILDIGASVGEKFNDSLNLINKGCGAFLVQPSIKEYKKLNNFHELNEKVKCFPFAIGSKNGMVEIGEKDYSIVVTNSEDETVKQKIENNYTQIKVIGMDFYSFTVTAEHDRFNLININAAGNEYEILNQIDLDAVGCEVIVINHNNKYKDMYLNYISQFRFKLVFEDKETLIFKK